MDASGLSKAILNICQTALRKTALLVLTVGCLAVINGCERVTVSSYQELERFMQAGAVTPKLDGDVVAASCWKQNSYRLVIGDVISLDMPAIMKISTSELPEWTGKNEPYSARVNAEGNVFLPVAGPVRAAGLTLSELESRIVQTYYPKYLVNYPSVVASVERYQTSRVSISGAVEKSGIFELREDQMSLVNLLMLAGGIKEDGASVIRISRSGDSQFDKPIIMPVKGMNIPFEDIALANGDRVVVEVLLPQMFTVIGLVERPGAYPFTPGVRYNIMQAIAFAGGLDEVADPRYVRVYRQDLDGEIVSALFPLDGKEANNTLKVMLKPGDIVAVEQTPRTRTRTLLSEIVKFNFGLQALYRLDNGENIY